MRSLEHLIQLFPNLTGTEILALQEKDKLKDEEEFQRRNKREIRFINDINKNGGYYRGRFGLDQHFFYNVTNVRLENQSIIGDVTSLVLFNNKDKRSNSVIRIGEIEIERRVEEHKRLENYSLESYERVTVKEWNEVNKYVDDFDKFWDK